MYTQSQRKNDKLLIDCVIFAVEQPTFLTNSYEFHKGVQQIEVHDYYLSNKIVLLQFGKSTIIYLFGRGMKYTGLVVVPCYYSRVTSSQVAAIRTCLHDAVNSFPLGKFGHIFFEVKITGIGCF